MPSDVRDLEQANAATVRLDSLKCLSQPHLLLCVAAFPLLDRRAVREVVSALVDMQPMPFEVVVELEGAKVFVLGQHSSVRRRAWLEQLACEISSGAAIEHRLSRLRWLQRRITQ